MKRINFLLMTFLIALFYSIPVHAQVSMKKLAQSTMNFLSVSVLPRASAMGNAYTAVGVGAESIFYNPAGLSHSSQKYNAILARTSWIADINYNTGALSWDMGNIGVFGLSFLMVDYGDIHGTRLTRSPADPIGYEDIGTLDNVGAYSYGLSYSRQISTKFSLGGTIQYVGQQLGDNVIGGSTIENKESSISFNLGVLYYTGFKSFRFGMVIRNFGPAIEYQEVSTSLPLNFVMGGAMDLMDLFMPGNTSDSSLLFSLGFSHPNNYTERVNVGAEYTFLNMLSLRGGYEFNQDIAGLTAGFGVTPEIAGSKLDFSYSYSDFDLFQGVNRLSIAVSF